MIVVDTSVALKWVLPEVDAERADKLLGRKDLRAPDVVLVEVANVLAKKVRAGDMTGPESLEAFDIVRSAFANLERSDALAERALRLSIELSHPVYDCVFLACAEALKSSLVSCDAAFTKRVRDRGYGHYLAPLPV